MKTQNIIDGLLLLQKYRRMKNSYDVGAEHDVIYAYPTDEPLEHEAINMMIDLGWTQDNGGSDFSVENYDRDESWVARV